MKKFIKNTLLTFVILYTILNLAFFVNIMILKNSMLREEILPLLSEDRDVAKSIEIEEGIKETIEERKEIYGKDAPVTALFAFENYFAGMGQFLYPQTSILIITLIISVAIGIIISLTEKSKMKAILYFILIGLVLSVLYTMYIQLSSNLYAENFFEGITEEFTYTIKTYGIYYIIIYLLVYVARYIIDKKKMKELNEEIEKKNK